METSNDIIFYDIERAKFIVKDAIQLDIAYAYDNLLFTEHGLIILQFVKENADLLYCWFNKECSVTYRDALFESLRITSELNKTLLQYKGTFEMKQKEGKEEIDISFYD